MAGNAFSGGSNRKPTVMKVMQGTARKDRMNPNEPKGDAVKIPQPPPEYLEAEAKAVWARDIAHLVKMGVFSESDYSFFEGYCIERGRYIRLEKEIQVEGENLTS